ncbi:shikimate dehydrogenase [Kutzneria viridogrisea]|uniref:Shikimate-5-dehydrogenase n=2 Tax=Kutzneria TaxID=43356 RepID=W5W4B6_9PSEU|nr:shikimate dehydrogenase [Kutzneria albida]AHH96083.1 shikimate-5-dehydrogenase [Kutzneria albida DSM 43870]MBA8928710.1 shikimate dehydrogenase [Kutzneria viridogrisea]
MSSRRAAVLGSPIEHSLSPVLHQAAYAALGLDWSFERIRCEAAELPGLVDGSGPEWAGFAVTMPGKRAAYEHAVQRSEVADLVEAANTLVPREQGGWFADCTDVQGICGAVRAAGGWPERGAGSAVLLGAGGTATAAVVAAHLLGVQQVTIVVRDPARAAEAVRCAEKVGVGVAVRDWSQTRFGELCAAADLVVSTVPSAAVVDIAEDLARARFALDAIYHPWPTPIADAAARRGTRLVTGLDMLLHQAFTQVWRFTGEQAPKAEMRAALHSATGGLLPLPI